MTGDGWVGAPSASDVVLASWLYLAEVFPLAVSQGPEDSGKLSGLELERRWVTMPCGARSKDK